MEYKLHDHQACYFNEIALLNMPALLSSAHTHALAHPFTSIHNVSNYNVLTDLNQCMVMNLNAEASLPR